MILFTIGKQKDLAVSNTAKRDELLDELLAWQASINAPFPSRPNPDYDSNATSNDQSKMKKCGVKRSNTSVC